MAACGCMSPEMICDALRPPPLPDPINPNSSSVYATLYDFITTNATLNKSVHDYNDMCNTTYFPPSDPDIGKTTEVSTSTIISTRASTSEIISATPNESSSTTQSMMGNTTSPLREITEGMTPDKQTTTEKFFRAIGEETASGSLAIWVPILVVLLIALAVTGVVIVVYIKKNRKKSSYNVDSDENGALPIHTYKNTNFLHNQAENKKQWQSSSLQGSKDDGKAPDKVENDVENKVITNGGDKIRDDLFEMKKSNDSDPVTGIGIVNENFVLEKEEANPESPGVKSVKSDTPLIPGDGIDGNPLPNQPMNYDNKPDNSTKVPRYGSLTNGPLSTNLPQKNTALPPLAKQEQVNFRSPTKKKKRSLGKVIKSEECQTRNGFVEDMADNRNST